MKINSENRITPIIFCVPIEPTWMKKGCKTKTLMDRIIDLKKESQGKFVPIWPGNRLIKRLGLKAE